jgi:hypothetical protein
LHRGDGLFEVFALLQPCGKNRTRMDELRELQSLL